MSHRLRNALGDTSGLDVWDAEGGGLSGASAAQAAGADRAPVSEKALLCRLGSAVVGEWAELAMPLRRSLYERAVGDLGEPTLRRQMAQLLHDQHRRHHGG